MKCGDHLGSIRDERTAVSQALVGAWRLVSSEFRLSSGEVIHPYGTDAVGLLIYTEDGQMSAQIMRRGGPAFASGDTFGGTPEETKKAMDGVARPGITAIGALVWEKTVAGR
jgi:hypothetical protein